MTLRQLIERSTAISRRLSDSDIPVIYRGVSDTISSIELSQDNNGNYYVNLR